MAYSQGGLIEAVDFNTFQAAVNTVYGTGFGNSGYGQTAVTIPTVTGGNVELIKSVEWTALRNALQTCLTHQGSATTTPSVAALATGSLVQAHPPAAGDFPNAITEIQANRFNFSGTARTTFFDVVTSTRSTGWSTQIQHEFTVTFTTADDARYFFNSGGQLLFRGSRTGGSGTPQNSAWTTMLSNMGNVIFNYDQTVSSNAVGTGTGIGYYDLTGSYQQLYTITSSSANYTSNDWTLYGRYNDGAVPVGANGDNGQTLQFRIDFNDDHSNVFSDQVSGTIQSSIDLVRATNPLTVAAPVFATITDLTAGS